MIANIHFEASFHSVIIYLIYELLFISEMVRTQAQKIKDAEYQRAKRAGWSAKTREHDCARQRRNYVLVGERSRDEQDALNTKARANYARRKRAREPEGTIYFQLNELT